MYMAYSLDEFPFHGVFYSVPTETPEDGDLIGDGNSGSSDGDLIGDGNLLEDDEATDTEDTTATEQETASETDTDASDTTDEEETANEVILLETECDIQQAAKLINSGTIMADFKVFFPCEVGEKLPIRFNTKFRCEDYAIPIQGYVVGLEYSQLGGCHVDIKMNEV